MSNRTERELIIRSGSPTRRHSMSNQVMHHVRDSMDKVFPQNNKAEKARAKRERERRFLENFPRLQFDRCLGNMAYGEPTPQEVRHVFRQVGKYERAEETWFNKRGQEVTEVTIAFVDVSPRITTDKVR